MKLRKELGSEVVQDLIREASTRVAQLPPMDLRDPWPSYRDLEVRAMAVKLDIKYPHLSELVRSVLNIDLEQLASRAPCAETFQYFDLERLLAAVRDNPLFNSDFPAFVAHAEQVRGYLATLDDYAALGVLKDRAAFVLKKLAAPREPAPKPPGSEMLDTLAECQWGLWLHERYGKLEAEKLLPGGVGDADFYVITQQGPLWIDCISVEPRDPQYDLATYLATKVRSKWRSKFGARPSAMDVPAAIAVSLWKMQEHVAPTLIRDEIVGTTYEAQSSLWASCPGLRYAWFGLPPWNAQAQRPNVFATWTRPGAPALP